MTERPEVTIGVLIFSSKGEILLLKSPKWNNRYIVPCGHVEFGEKLVDTVMREIKEETNLKVENIQFLKVLELIQSDEYFDKNAHFVCIQFTCNAINTEVVLNDEANEYIWLNPEKAFELEIDSLTRQSIQEFLFKLKTLNR